MSLPPTDDIDRDDDSEDRDFNPDTPTENIPQNVIDEPMNPQFTYRNWENYKCESKRAGREFAKTLRDNGVIDYAGALVFDGEVLEFQSPQADGYFQALPYFEASRMELDIQISARNPENELDPQRWEEKFSITLETGDSFTLDVVSNAMSMSLIKNGKEFLDANEIDTVSNMYNEFYVIVKLKSYQECTLIQEQGGGGGEDDDPPTTDNDDTEGVSLYVILGGLVAFIILSFIISTTGDRDGS